jgi:hypothetical protein
VYQQQQITSTKTFVETFHSFKTNNQTNHFGPSIELQSEPERSNFFSSDRFLVDSVITRVLLSLPLPLLLVVAAEAHDHRFTNTCRTSLQNRSATMRDPWTLTCSKLGH